MSTCGSSNSSNNNNNNNAILPKGRLYMSFPVWTQENLAIGRAQRDEAAKKANDSLAEKDEEMAKMAGTSNPFSKLMHYRNAYEKMENYFMSGWQKLKEMIPATNDDIIDVGGGLLIQKKGTVFTKQNAGPAKNLIGIAQVSESKTLDDDEE